LSILHEQLSLGGLWRRARLDAGSVTDTRGHTADSCSV